MAHAEAVLQARPAETCKFTLLQLTQGHTQAGVAAAERKSQGQDTATVHCSKKISNMTQYCKVEK